MIFYEKAVKRAIRKGLLPKEIFKKIDKVFVVLDATKDLDLFDIKQLKSSRERTYYRLRKGKFRALFYIDEGDYYVISIAKREEVYKQWE